MADETTTAADSSAPSAAMTSLALSEDNASENNKEDRSGSNNSNNAQNTNDMLEITRATLDNWGLVYKTPNVSNPNNPIIDFGMTGKSANYRALISLDLEDDIWGFYYICPIKINEHKRSEVARLLAAANYKVMLGHLDLDYRDGEVRFKISTIVRGTKLSQEMVKQMIGIAMKTMDRYFPAIMACAFGDNITAEEAMRQAEDPPSHTQQASSPPQDSAAQ